MVDSDKFLELNEFYSKRNKEILEGERKGMTEEKNKEREKISHIIADSLLAKRSEQQRQKNDTTKMESEMRRLNIHSVRLPPLDVELERKKIKKEVKMANRAKNFDIGKEKTVIHETVKGKQTNNAQTSAMANKSKVNTVGIFSLELNGKIKNKRKKKADAEKGKQIPGPSKSRQPNLERARNAEVNFMPHEENEVGLFRLEPNEATNKTKHEIRRINILSVRLPPLDLELERKKIKKAKKVANKSKKVVIRKEKPVLGPRDRGQNPRFKSKFQPYSVVNEEKEISSCTSKQLQTATARRHSTGDLYFQKVPQDQVPGKYMVRSMPARRDAVCDLTAAGIHYKGRTQARVIFKRFGEDYKSGNVHFAAQTSTSKLKLFLSLKSSVFKL